LLCGDAACFGFCLLTLRSREVGALHEPGELHALL
jgi:hypothetical protein